MKGLRPAALLLLAILLPAWGKEISPPLPTPSYINIDPHLTRGYELLSRFRFDKAVPELQKAAAENAGRPPIASEAYTYLGYAAMSRGNRTEARRDFHAAIRLNHANDLAYFFMANELFTEGDKQGSRDALLMAITVNPSFVSAMRMLAESYMDDGNPKQALVYYKKITEFLPQSGSDLSRLFHAYEAAGDLSSAETVAKHLIALEPDDLPNYARLAEVYLAANNPAAAKQIDESALAKDPRFEPAYLGLAKADLAQKDFKGASIALREAEKNHPSDLELSQTENFFEQQRRQTWMNRWRYGPLILLIGLFITSLSWGLYHSKRKKEILRVMTWFNRGQEQIYELGELSKYIVNFFMDVGESEIGALFLYSRQGNQLRLSAARGINSTEHFSPLVTGPQVSNWTLQNTKPVLRLREIEGFFFEESFPSLRDRLIKEGFEIIIPLTERNLLLGMAVLGKGTRGVPADVIEPLSNTAARAIESLYLYESSVTDETTSLYNKRFFRQSLQAEIRRSDRYNQPCSLLAFDIDDFKKINDTYGHPQGDRVLKEIAGCLRECLRDGIDIAARTGGEEFNVVLPATDMDHACKVAERLRTSVAGHAFSGFGDGFRVTISLGVATYPMHATEESELVGLADKALYLSKAKGKNKTCVAGEAREEPPPKHETQRAEKLNLYDSGSSLYHPEYFAHRFKEELKRSVRFQFPCSLVILGFDAEGGRTAFDCIRQFAQGVKEGVRMGIDIPACVDREHVGIILPETEKEKAVLVAERLAKLAKGFLVSAGIVSFPKDGLTEEALLTRAFSALEEAQGKGGGRCVLWEDRRA